MNYHTEIQKLKNISYIEAKYCHSNILWNAAALQKTVLWIYMSKVKMLEVKRDL